MALFMLVYDARWTPASYMNSHSGDSDLSCSEAPHTLNEASLTLTISQMEKIIMQLKTREYMTTTPVITGLLRFVSFEPLKGESSRLFGSISSFSRNSGS